MLAPIPLLAECGLRIFPLKPRGKTPQFEGWQTQATCEPHQIAEWQEKLPQANWAVATGPESHVFVVDLGGGQGHAWLALRISEHGEAWTKTRRVFTPGKLKPDGTREPGQHLYFTYPEGREVHCSNDVVARGVDVRGLGGLVVVPPSEHPDGGEYTWLDESPIADAPDWLLHEVTRSKSPAAPPAATTGEKIPVTKRHKFMVAQAAKLISSGIGYEALEVELLRINREMFEEPKPEAVIVKQARDLFDRYQQQPSVLLIGKDANLDGVGRLISAVEPKDVAWLWEPYIPAGMISILTGDPGAGKSYIALSIAARLSLVGRGTVYLTIENSPEYILRPRFDALGGDPRRVYLLEGVGTVDGGVRNVQLQDINVIEKAIEEHGARLVIIDPIQSYLGANVDAHRANETRPIMDALVRLAERTGTAILIVRHGSKNGSGRAIYKGQGSIDFTAAARSELMAGETSSGQKAMVHIKPSVGPMGPAQGYEITSTNPAGQIVKAGYFRWMGECEIGSAELMEVEKHDGAKEEAKEFLVEFLANGPRLATECYEEAKQFGISKRTLERVRSVLKIRPYRLTVPGPWNWSLPTPRPPSSPKAFRG